VIQQKIEAEQESDRQQFINQKIIRSNLIQSNN
jgi:hypothetical protein